MEEPCINKVILSYTILSYPTKKCMEITPAITELRTLHVVPNDLQSTTAILYFHDFRVSLVGSVILMFLTD